MGSLFPSKNVWNWTWIETAVTTHVPYARLDPTMKCPKLCTLTCCDSHNASLAFVQCSSISTHFLMHFCPLLFEIDAVLKERQLCRLRDAFLDYSIFLSLFFLLLTGEPFSRCWIMDLTGAQIRNSRTCSISWMSISPMPCASILPFSIRQTTMILGRKCYKLFQLFSLTIYTPEN